MANKASTAAENGIVIMAHPAWCAIFWPTCTCGVLVTSNLRDFLLVLAKQWRV